MANSKTSTAKPRRNRLRRLADAATFAAVRGAAAAIGSGIVWLIVWWLSHWWSGIVGLFVWWLAHR